MWAAPATTYCGRLTTLAGQELNDKTLFCITVESAGGFNGTNPVRRHPHRHGLALQVWSCEIRSVSVIVAPRAVLQFTEAVAEPDAHGGQADQHTD